MTALRGATLDARNPVARPSPAWLKRLGHTGGRLVATDTDAFYGYQRRLSDAGLGTAVLLTLDSFPSGTDPHSLYEQAKMYAGALDYNPPSLWVVGNEWQIDGAASWPLGDGPFATAWNAIYEGLRVNKSETPIWLGGLFSEPNIVEHLKQILEELDYGPDGVDLHLYRETIEVAERILSDVGAFMPVSVLEWNDSTPEGIAAYQRVLTRLTAHSCFLPLDRRQTITEAQPLPGLVSGTRTTALGRAYTAALKGAA